MATFPAVTIGDASSLRDVGTLHSQLQPMAEAIQILAGQRGNSRAVMTDTIKLQYKTPWTVLKQIRAPGAAVTSAAGGVPTYNDYIQTLNDLQQLVADVATIQEVLRTLIQNLSE